MRADRDFYSQLQLVEMRAKPGLELKAASLDAAREQVIASFGASVDDFTADEQAALRDAINHLQPILESQAPLYARTPWYLSRSSRISRAGCRTHVATVLCGSVQCA
jgi:hypothetical protein